MADPQYKNISCDFYDHFEIFAMQKVWVKATLINGDTKILKIKTLHTKEDGEFLITTLSEEIRLDQIAGIEAVNYDSDLRYFLLNKVDYNFQANNSIIQRILDQQVHNSSVNKLMSHIFNALGIWTSRIHDTSYQFNVWQLHDQSNWYDLNQNLSDVCLSTILENNPARVINYKNTTGIIGKMTVSQIMYHMINHSTYHRGQIAIKLTELGHKAVSTDYFKFL